MIRGATIEDIEDLLLLGRKFFDATQYDKYMDYSENQTRLTIEQLINDDNGILLVLDDDGLKGMIGGMVYPFYMSGQLTGQELFWWCDLKGAGLSLLDALEDKAKELGAKTFNMITLHGLGHERLNDIYLKRGYSRSENTYIRGL